MEWLVSFFTKEELFQSSAILLNGSATFLDSQTVTFHGSFSTIKAEYKEITHEPQFNHIVLVEVEHMNRYVLSRLKSSKNLQKISLQFFYCR